MDYLIAIRTEPLIHEYDLNALDANANPTPVGFIPEQNGIKKSSLNF